MTTLMSFLLFGAMLIPGCVKVKNSDPPPDNPNSGTKILVWSDEFDYNGLPSEAKWSYDTAGNESGWGNNESQFYTQARSKNVQVKDGFLSITAHKEDYKGFKYT
ncbi:MAG: glycoside hydrolase family 16 protein, partial [Bacteroidales bacterium]|nr:glycoside hydrolase family 16 protein [Bacteroidales bacterium]